MVYPGGITEQRLSMLKTIAIQMISPQVYPEGYVLLRVIMFIAPAPNNGHLGWGRQDFFVLSL